MGGNVEVVRKRLTINRADRATFANRLANRKNQISSSGIECDDDSPLLIRSLLSPELEKMSVVCSARRSTMMNEDKSHRRLQLLFGGDKDVIGFNFKWPWLPCLKMKLLP
ncbi:hypothetical protein ACLOJK_023379 [Asimina triloba]